MLVSSCIALWILAGVPIVVYAQQVPNFIPQQPNIPQGPHSFLPQVPNRCKDPTSVINCYVRYLEKYGIRPTNGFLPPFVLLERYVKTQIDLFNTCRDFDELEQCLGINAQSCINVPVFSTYTQRMTALNEAIYYVQNHGFFEFVCGAGRPVFMANSDCLSRAFSGASLTKRMHRCAQGADLANNCPAAVTMATCVRANMEVECGVPAGVASCGAATNIIRREGEVDTGCLYQMDQLCSSSQGAVHLSLFLSFILLFLYCL